MTEPATDTEERTARPAARTSGPPGTVAGAGDEDRRLVAALLAGDEGVFRRLVTEHHAAPVRLATVFVPSRAVAEEVAQETWAGVLNGLSRFEGRSTLRTWIFRILTNRAKTRGVREGRSAPFSGLAAGEGDAEPAVSPGRFLPSGMWAAPPRRWASDTPERLAMQREALERLATALDDLPPSQRAVVTLRDVEGFSSDEVCNILEISETNQRVLLHRGRSKLRRILEDYVDGT